MASRDPPRRLATILAADVVGYSRLMAEDEDATVRTLKAYRAIIDRLIDRHDGRIFHTAGDSVVAEFGSAVEAVRCAITIQDELRVRNAELDEARRMNLRIGINIGDVIVDGDDLLGDGVNVAARLESLASAGGICISGGTFEQVKNKLSIGFEDLGPQAVKNLPDPVAAFRITGAPVTVRDSGPGTPALRRGPSPGALIAAGVAVAGLGFIVVTWLPEPGSIPLVPVPLFRSPQPVPPGPVAGEPVAAATPVEPSVASTPPSGTGTGFLAPPAAEAPPARSGTEDLATAGLPAGEIAALVTGLTIRGTRRKDGQPFTIELHEAGRAGYAFPRGGAGAGTTFRASGEWRVEDGRFCMRFRGFNGGEEACPVLRHEDGNLVAQRPDGTPLDWTFTRTDPGRSAVAPSGNADSTDEMDADAIRGYVAGSTLRGVRPRDRRPFTIALRGDGTADLSVERPDRAPFRETGRWWSEDYRFCMVFATFGRGETLCPRIVTSGARPVLTKGDGTPLPWTLER
ncbi:MAG: adenylate/guanylate cyclase domain-containing protein [Gammaproteobacteria bacterium]|nr:adenylate/guanylate cyclase domain-containing protein [Gammaproteobacteria bacterium]